MLEREKILAIIQPGGPLSIALKGYEAREQQQKMLSNVVDAYNSNQIALIEAGTGTGKSIAYLIPALMWALKTKEKTVISTNTINLQEQLIEKDIPLLLKALNLNLKAVLVKGMSNYICKRKLVEAEDEMPLLPENEKNEIAQIAAYEKSSKEGSRSKLPMMPSSTTWERVCAEGDTCNRNQCRFYQECHFFKARKEAADANILVANHHLIFADLTTRIETNNFTDTAILPHYSRLIIDEAHNVEDIATEYLAAKASRMEFLRIMSRLFTEKNNKTFGKIPLLKDKILQFTIKKKVHDKLFNAILMKLNSDLPAERRDLLIQIGETFHAYYEFMQQFQHADDADSGEGKLRIRQAQKQHDMWNNDVLVRTRKLVDGMRKYAQGLHSLETELEKLKYEELEEQTKGIVFEIKAMANRLDMAANALHTFAFGEEDVNRVQWIQSQMWKNFPNVELINATLDISPFLAEHLFNKIPTVILCSATLTTNQKFDFIKERLGIDKEILSKRKKSENSYDSPFNYAQQAMLAIPTDIPSPDHKDFIAVASEKIFDAIKASNGNAFVLFTSYAMLSACYARLEAKLKQHRFIVMKQGDDQRQALLNKFKETDYSVLFGTDSFWEGVDVAGEALRCVILVKLPFKVPSEPILQARSEQISAKGGNPFMDYFVPQAIVKFKQGFGRLIRKNSDRGCIVCLDSRIVTKQYGKLFINSLPSCQKAYEPSAELNKKMINFYRETYHLVNKSR